MSRNIQRLGESLVARMQKTANAASSIQTELGIINSNMSLIPDSLQAAIPKGDYMISAGQDPKPGDRVLLAWCGSEPVIISTASTAVKKITVTSDGQGNVTVTW
jgi:hypothetical protein